MFFKLNEIYFVIIDLNIEFVKFLGMLFKLIMYIVYNF